VLTDAYPSAAANFDHQRLDHRALLAPVTKWSATLVPARADGIVTEAVERALSGVPGPVHLDVPSDAVGTVIDSAPTLAPAPERRLNTIDNDVASAESILASSRHPLMIVGLGARHAADAAAVRRFVERHRIPALVTYKAKGVVPDGHPCFAGVLTNGAVESPLLEEADAFLAIGFDPVELLPRPWRSSRPLIACGRWRVDSAHVKADVQIVGDISTALDGLSGRMRSTSWNLDDLRRNWTDAVSLVRNAGAGEHPSPSTSRLRPARAVEIVSTTARNALVTVDAGAHMLPATVLWPVNEPNGLLISNGLSTMGFALPAAIGAALLDRTRPVVALTGDGGLLMCVGELSTAAREQLRVVVVVFNDRALSLIDIKQRQRRLPRAGVSVGEIGWCGVAESLGVAAHLACTDDQLAAAFARAMAADGPTLIEVLVDPSSYDEILRVIRGR